MVSTTAAYMTRKRLREKNMGRKRKNQLAKKGSTPTREAFFGDGKKGE